MHATSATGSRGFTLLELLVVLTILVLITTAWPLASSHVFVAQHLRNESQQLASAIRLAQMTARTSGIPQKLTIAREGRAYQIASEAHELPEGVTLRIHGDSPDTPQSRLLLFPDGSSSGAMLVMSLRDHTSTLQVLPVTGRLEMSP